VVSQIAEKYTEEEILAGCLAENRHFQEILYRKYADKMYNVSLTYAEDDDEACDILQEGFIKVFRKINTFKGDCPIEAWIRRIIINTAIEFFRKRKREFEVLESYEYSQTGKIDDLLSRINAKEIIKMVNQLPAKARMVLKLYAIEGYSHKEISELLNISEGTSKSQLNRSRSMLKTLISQNNG
jgi:RNA polymerase sigma factor (sigma-70 family)